MSSVGWVRFNTDPSEFQIYFKDSIEEIVTDYTADSPYECGAYSSRMCESLVESTLLIVRVVLLFAICQPRLSPS